MNLVFDNLIFLLQKSGGISVYWSELLKRAILDDELNSTFVGEGKINNIFRENLNIDSKYIKNTNNTLLGRLKALNISLKESYIFHSSYYRYVNQNRNSKNVLTIHDFIQEKYHNNKLSLNSLMKKKAISNADFIITVSSNTKSDLLNYYKNLDESIIKVIPNGISNDFFPMLNQPKENFSLFVGSRVYYKNFQFAVEVVKNIKNLNFIIAGSPLSKEEVKFLNQKIPNRWQIYVYPSNSELNLLYNKALVLLYPSSYEGFGIPIIEAMRCYCPVISLNNSSIPEIANGHAILHDKLIKDDFISSIEWLIHNQFDFSGAYNNSLNYNWDNTYLETKEVYKILNKNKS